MQEIQLTHGPTRTRHEEKQQNLKHDSIEPNGGEKSNRILAELIHEMQQVAIVTENLRKRFYQMLKLN